MSATKVAILIVLFSVTVSAQVPRCQVTEVKSEIVGFSIGLKCELAPTPTPTPIPTATPTPTPTPTATPTPLPTPSGFVSAGRSVRVSSVSGPTLGDKLNAAKTKLNGPGEIIVDEGGASNQEFIVEGTQTLRVGPGVEIKSNYGAGGFPYIVVKDGGSVVCDSLSSTFYSSTAPGSFVVLKPYNTARDNKDRASRITVRGCTFKGVGKIGDGGQGMLSMGNCHDCAVEGNVIDGPEAIGVVFGGATANVASGGENIDHWKNTQIIKVQNQGVNGAYSSLLITTGSGTVPTPHQYQVGDRVATFDVTNSVEISPYGPLRTRMYGIWYVVAVPSPSTFIVNNLHVAVPCDNSGPKPCGNNSVDLLNEARNVSLKNNVFVRGMRRGVDAACVNCAGFQVHGNRHSLFVNGPGAGFDGEPNTEFDVLTGCSVTGNTYDFSGFVGNVAVAGIIINNAGSDHNGPCLIADNVIIGGDYQSTVKPTGIGSLDPDRNNVVNKTGGSIPAVGIAITLMRDTVVSGNIIRGGYQTAMQASGERLTILNNIVTGVNGGNFFMDDAKGLKYSIIRDNSCETKDGQGNDISYNVNCKIIESHEASGNNRYWMNFGITEYSLRATSKWLSRIDREKGLQFSSP